MFASVFFQVSAINSRKKKREKEQSKNNRRALAALEKNIDFSLYLRPFDTEDSIVYDNATVVDKIFAFVPGNALNEDAVDFEFYLSSSLENECALYAIGSPTNSMGAAKVFVPDDGWNDTFCDLAKRAKVIFVLPFYTLSTAYEIRWLKENNVLKKVIFIMPDDVPVGVVGEDFDEKNIFDVDWVSDKWEKGRKKYAKCGINLPEFCGDGVLFQLDVNGDYKFISILGKSEIRKALRFVLNNELGSGDGEN